ncbi:hypothetical protein PC122_g9025 [Phytophthora cactorum]|nr:hypothetical protein PC122_g9025 [Phytophthora cactorum]
MAQYNWSLLHDVVSNKRRKPHRTQHICSLIVLSTAFIHHISAWMVVADGGGDPHV